MPTGLCSIRGGMEGAPGTSSNGSFGEVIARAYPSLKQIAAAKAAGTGLSPSSLVQDTLCRMLRMPKPPQSEDEARAVAFGIMRWVLIDRLRSERARDAREEAAGLERAANKREESDKRLEDLAAALSALAEGNPRKAEVMTLSAVCGLGNARIAELLSISEKTVARDLEFARAWVASYRPDGST